MQVKLMEITEDAEKLIIYIARVSNPQNQSNPEYAKLLNYCIKNEHWSVFEHSHMTLEIETSLAIATQILRHRSFTFQQFSQRYSNASQLGFEPVQLRKQTEKNRQSSAEIVDGFQAEQLQRIITRVVDECERAYLAMLDAGIARECARFVLPQCTMTRLYMTGNIRSWIHYIQLRSQENTQWEHRQVALSAKRIFISQLPVTAQALGWTEEKIPTDADALEQ